MAKDFADAIKILRWRDYSRISSRLNLITLIFKKQTFPQLGSEKDVTVKGGQEGDVMLVALKTQEGGHKARNVGSLKKLERAGEHSP